MALTSRSPRSMVFVDEGVEGAGGGEGFDLRRGQVDGLGEVIDRRVAGSRATGGELFGEIGGDATDLVQAEPDH